MNLTVLGHFYITSHNFCKHFLCFIQRFVYYNLFNGILVILTLTYVTKKNEYLVVVEF